MDSGPGRGSSLAAGSGMSLQENAHHPGVGFLAAAACKRASEALRRTATRGAHAVHAWFGTVVCWTEANFLVKVVILQKAQFSRCTLPFCSRDIEPWRGASFALDQGYSMEPIHMNRIRSAHLPSHVQMG